MSKVKFNKSPLIYPMPAVLIGSVVNGKPTFTTIGNCGCINVRPAVVYISLNKTHYVNKGIRENQVFSINVPSADLAEKVDYCGITSGENVDKSQVFECTYESSNKIPLVKDCPVNLECKVIKSFDVYGMEVFIAEIIETYVDEEVLTNGHPDTKKINALIYSMDQKYWETGDVVGEAFSMGKNLKF